MITAGTPATNALSGTGRAPRTVGRALARAGATVGACTIAAAITASPSRAVSAQAPSGTPWPVVTAAISPPEITPVRFAPSTAATAVPLAPIAEDPADVDAVARRSPWGYLAAGILGAVGAGMYGWSAWRRLRDPS